MGRRVFEPDQVRAIRNKCRACLACGHARSLKDVGKEYGVSAVTVHNIVRRKIYKDVD